MEKEAKTFVPYLFIGFGAIGMKIFRGLTNDIRENQPSLRDIHQFLCLTPAGSEVVGGFERCADDDFFILKSIGTNKAENLDLFLKEAVGQIDTIRGLAPRGQSYNSIGIDSRATFSKIMIFIIADLREKFTREYLGAFLKKLLNDLYSGETGRGRQLFYICPFVLFRTKTEEKVLENTRLMVEIKSALMEIFEIAENKERLLSSIFLFDGETLDCTDLWSDEKSIENYLTELLKLFIYVDIFANDIRMLYTTDEYLFNDKNKPVYKSLGIKVMKFPAQEMLSYASLKGMIGLCDLIVKDDGRDVGDTNWFKQEKGQIEIKLKHIESSILEETPKLRELGYSFGDEPEKIFGDFKDTINNWKNTIKDYFQKQQNRIKKSNREFCSASSTIRENFHKSVTDEIANFSLIYKNGLTLGGRFLQGLKDQFLAELKRQPVIQWVPPKQAEVGFEDDLKKLENILKNKPNQKTFVIYSALQLIIFPWILTLLIPINYWYFNNRSIRFGLWIAIDFLAVLILRFVILDSFKNRVDNFFETVTEKANSLMRSHKGILDSMAKNLIDYWKSRVLDHFYRYLCSEESLIAKTRNYLELIENISKKNEKDSAHKKELYKKLKVGLSKPEFVPNLFTRYFISDGVFLKIEESVNQLFEDEEKEQISILKDGFAEEKYLKDWHRHRLYPEEFFINLQNKVNDELKIALKEMTLINYIKKEDISEEIDSIPAPLYFDSTGISTSHIRPEINEKYVSANKVFQNFLGQLPFSNRYEMSLPNTIILWRPFLNLSKKALRLFL
jgi:hypothetical protein